MKITDYKLLFVALILFATTACKKQEVQSAKKGSIDIGALISDYLAQSQKPKDGIITIVARTPIGHNGEKAPADMMVDARFYENSDIEKPFFAGDLEVGKLSIPFFNKANGEPNGYELQTGVNVSKASLPILKSIWGTKIGITLTAVSNSSTKVNSVFPTLVKTNSLDENGFYIPAQMDVESSSFTNNGNYAVAINNASNVYWTPDPGNPSGTIMIGVVSEGNSDPNNPVPAELIYFKEVPDTGFYTLTAADYSALSVGGLATLFLARGNYTVYTDANTSNQVLIQALTYATVAFLGVVN